MRLLFDANLSPRLVQLLDDVFPTSRHVLDCGDISSDDMGIWDFAKANGLSIVTKDSDFHRMSFVLGAPPKVIGVRVGNGPTAVVEQALRSSLSEIQAFEADPEASFLIV